MLVAVVSGLLLTRCPEHMWLLSSISFVAILCGIGICCINTYLHEKNDNNQHLDYLK